MSDAQLAALLQNELFRRELQSHRDFDFLGFGSSGVSRAPPRSHGSRPPPGATTPASSAGEDWSASWTDGFNSASRAISSMGADMKRRLDGLATQFQLGAGGAGYRDLHEESTSCALEDDEDAPVVNRYAETPSGTLSHRARRQDSPNQAVKVQVESAAGLAKRIADSSAAKRDQTCGPATLTKSRGKRGNRLTISVVGQAGPQYSKSTENP
eukprot:CAMPEP_0118986326 /NCGR_PEP_ID=MMETSP1173-20130426/41873_1 /TAXON_ID=1034831 /ORGANISM="Rhizochromulina marina cf, Strain CCMP1243" /LENGTH=211 /DNA_ID=CAMNT_0006937101 /DNA_START=14 /DNA_END=650 /DNA_ORIENTATION=-